MIIIIIFIIITFIIVALKNNETIVTRAAVYPALYAHESCMLTQMSSFILLCIFKIKLAK